MSKDLFFLSLATGIFATTIINMADSKADIVAFNSYSYTASETNFTAIETSPGEDTDFVDFNSYA